MSQINDAFGRPLFEAMRGTPPPSWEQTCLKLSEEKRELQSDVNELKELVEYLRDKIKRMEELGDTLANCTSDNPYNARYAEQWWDLRGIKHE